MKRVQLLVDDRQCFWDFKRFLPVYYMIFLSVSNSKSIKEVKKWASLRTKESFNFPSRVSGNSKLILSDWSKFQPKRIIFRKIFYHLASYSVHSVIFYCHRISINKIKSNIFVTPIDSPVDSVVYYNSKFIGSNSDS